MAEEIAEHRENATVHSVGAQLRAAREERELSLPDVAAETRIPLRHLESIEAGDFGSLPGRTYAVGFSKTYAQVVGLDPEAIAGMVRAELNSQQPTRVYRPSYEPGDPARVPSARIGWIVAILFLLLLVAGFFFFRPMFAPAAQLPPIEEEVQEPTPGAQPLPGTVAADPAQPATSGPVVFTALEDGVWVRFYTAGGQQLLEKEMAEGETFTVPQDADQPRVWTGRPDALRITVGGRELPKLSEEQRVMRDVPITAEALLARGGAAPSPQASPATQTSAAPQTSPAT
ncbi:helix-turn-helix domain-containing protein [Altericroceibacterium xinjiangense]|uniref:helix-turn-helix domain-containing protein n=1 Tax=Altericroceibacterium xinjiangense TaxID=762261 RepID=UPI000F7DFF4C|nr:RodZ domain-containing protein [Altericroceibacterium xinjiangense]